MPRQATTDVIDVVATRIRSARLVGRITRGVVVDPVMVTANGDKLIDDDAVDAVRRELLPLATVATPNRREAALLLRASECVVVFLSPPPDSSATAGHPGR